MKYFIAVLILAVYVLHQDTWNWANRSLVFGVLPVGLAYHACFSILCSAMMFVLVKTVWPKQMEEDVEALPDLHQGGGH
jgi:hypothetical protein